MRGSCQARNSTREGLPVPFLNLGKEQIAADEEEDGHCRLHQSLAHYQFQNLIRVPATSQHMISQGHLIIAVGIGYQYNQRQSQLIDDLELTNCAHN